MIKCRVTTSQLCRTSVRLFSSTLQQSGRNKNEIYHIEDRPLPVLEDRFRRKIKDGYKHPKSLAVVSPGKGFTQNVNYIFDQVLISHKEHLSSYLKAGEDLGRYIKHRKVPLEKPEIKARQSKVEDKIKEEFQIDFIDRQENPDPNVMKKLKRMENSVKCKWAPIEFDENGSITYLVSRSAFEYASLINILNQIKDLDEGYQPRTLFDFGSGICTGLWAAAEVFGQFSEAFMVDKSIHMNDLARMILDAETNSPSPAVSAGVSFRLQLPSTVSIKYELVISSQSLMELHSAQERLSVINNLWDRVEQGGYLVLAEIGTNAGFHVIAEARDYLIKVCQLEEEGGNVDVGGHCVAPCPHESQCPRHAHDTIPCNFNVKYNNFDIQELKSHNSSNELISYLIFKKEKRKGVGRPRLVEAPVKTKTCIYCRLCSAEGNLQEVLARKKEDPELFQLAKRLQWGDSMPVSLHKVENRKKIGTPWMKHNKHL